MRELLEFHLDQVTEEEIMPGFFGKMITGEKMNIAFWRITAGSSVPEHHHESEQCSYLSKGTFEFTINGVTKIYHPGDVVVIPSNMPHSGTALTECHMIDIWTPIRVYK